MFLGAKFPEREQLGLEMKGQTRLYLKNFFGACDKERINAILIDSASGRQEIAQVIRDLSDVVVYCCRVTRQFIEGTKWEIQNYLDITKGKIPKVIFYPIGVPIPQDAESEEIYEDALTQLRIMANLVRKRSDAIVADPLREVELFKWKETILSGGDGNNDRKAALSSYSNLADAIANFLR